MHLRDLTRFLAELADNNNRAWFVMNKPRYDILRAEFLGVVTELIPKLAKVDPAIANCNPRKALFRVHRDLRFARDKHPYKTHFSAALTASGLKKPSQGGGPAYYFHIDAAGMLLVAGGEYQPPADRVKRIRERIVADPAGFGAVLKDRKMKSVFGGLQEEDKLVRPPKGFATDVPYADHLKLKSFIVWTEESITGMDPDELPEKLLAGFKSAQPLMRWLRDIE